MRHWNYRVCKETYDAGTDHEEVLYKIHEVYYNSNGEICSISAKSVSPQGETLEELREDLKNYTDAINKDVIDIDTIIFSSNN